MYVLPLGKKKNRECIAVVRVTIYIAVQTLSITKMTTSGFNCRIYGVSMTTL